MFIATANVTDTIPAPLLDRMEVIEINGYTTKEKLEIGKSYLIPRGKLNNGLDETDYDIDDEGMRLLIQGYTRESGVRKLSSEVSSVFRKVARRIAEEEEVPKVISKDHVLEFLGPEKFLSEQRLKVDQIGVTTGLAWTAVGGELLFVEVTITRGKGTMSLTGQMGEVMRESAQTALTYVLANAEDLGINPGVYERSHVHIHVPQGAIPKDGPSAGIAIASALVSLLTKRPVSRNVAMTGEITLRGNVLEIGGLKEKALAAMRAGIRTVIIPKENERELVRFPQHLLDNVRFVAVEDIRQVFDEVLLPA